MISAFVSLVLLATSSSAGTLHAEMRVDSDVKPMKDVRVIYPDTPLGRRDEEIREEYEKRQGKFVAPGSDGSYAIGRIPGGFAIETRLGGDKIVPIPVLATLYDKELALSYGYCSFSRSRWLVNGNHGMSIVQWLIHDMPWADYRVTFKATDLGSCPPP